MPRSLLCALPLVLFFRLWRRERVNIALNVAMILFVAIMFIFAVARAQEAFASPSLQKAPLRPLAQSADIAFQRLSIEQGLSQPNVYAIQQDRTGFIWIATADGLNRYDGSSFKVYRRIPGDKTSLSDDFVISLFVDSKGILWVGTRDGGLNKYHSSSGTFSHYKHFAADPHSLSSNHVLAIAEDDSGQLWVGTENGLSRFNAKENNFTRALNGISINAVCPDTNGTVWLGSSNGLILFRSAATSGGSVIAHLRSEPSSRTGLAGNDISCLFRDPSGGLWIGTFTHGLHYRSPGHGTITHYTAETASQHGLTSNNIRAVAADAEQHIWVGTQGSGLYLFDKRTSSFTPYRYDPMNMRSLSGNLVYSLFQDRSGAFWVGTFGTGLNICSESSRIFRSYICDVESPSNIRTNAVYAICEDKRGVLWFGTEEGLVRLHRQTGTITRFPYFAPYLRHNQKSQPRHPTASQSPLLQSNVSTSAKSPFVRCISESRGGFLWLATDEGLYKVDPESMVIKHYPVSSAGSVTAHNIFSVNTNYTNIHNMFTITEHSSGELWIGTLGAGILCFDPTTEVFTRHYTTENSPLSHNIIRAIREDTHRRMWVGTRGGGINRFTPHELAPEKTWKIYRHNDDDPKTLSHDAIFCLYFDSKGTLWAGTQGGGLSKFHEDTETFTSWREEHGLANNVVYGILEDRNRCLWMSTHQGLARFSPDSASFTKFRNYDWRDGLQNNEFNAGAYFRGRDGRLYFGSIQGVNEFFGEEIRENAYVPPVVITSFKRFGEEIRLERDIAELDTIRISYKDNFFSLEFAALSFVQPDENRFKYILEGLDGKWIDAGRRHEVRYTNLSGGEYVFRVKACNNDGVWNTKGRALRIIVTPPVWEQWWFRAAGALVVVLGLALGYKARMRIMQNRTAALEAEVAKRTAELSESYERLQAANEEIQRQIELLDEQSRETEIANAALQEKNLEIEEERKKTDQLLLNVLPPGIAARLKAGESTIAEHFDNVSVLFADIVGFTELASTRPAAEVVDILNTIFSAFDIFSERYHLEKIKTIGDAYMIVGGVPTPHPNHAEAVADMALEMLETLNILRYTMKIDVQARIGIHTGSVVAGIIGQKKFSYDLWGDTVNTASRMESHGEPGQIHCTETLYDLLKHIFDFEERGYVDIKGKGLMKTYFLTSRRVRP